MYIVGSKDICYIYTGYTAARGERFATNTIEILISSCYLVVAIINTRGYTSWTTITVLLESGLLFFDPTGKRRENFFGGCYLNFEIS